MARAGTIVLLHAAGLDGRMWNGIRPRLAACNYSIICPDMLGHGSKRQASVGAMSDFADDIIHELHAAASPLVLVGLSLGGMVAQLVAGAVPERIERLVLCNTMCKPSEPLGAALRARARRTRRLGAAGMVDETVTRWFTPAALSSDLPDIAEVRRGLADTDTEANARTWEAIADFDGGPALLALQNVRTLVINGELDVATPAALSDEIVRRLPRARKVVLPAAGHMAPLEHPEAFVRLLTDFLEET